jgi:hypothetical protein
VLEFVEYRRRRRLNSESSSVPMSPGPALLADRQDGFVNSDIAEDQAAEEAMANGEGSAPIVLSRTRQVVLHIWLTVLLAGMALGLALVVPDISVVFGLLGGTTSSFLGFGVPGLLGLHLYRDLAATDSREAAAGGIVPPMALSGKRLRLVSWILLVGAAVVGVLTTAVTVLDMM